MTFRRSIFNLNIDWVNLHIQFLSQGRYRCACVPNIDPYAKLIQYLNLFLRSIPMLNCFDKQIDMSTNNIHSVFSFFPNQYVSTFSYLGLQLCVGSSTWILGKNQLFFKVSHANFLEKSRWSLYLIFDNINCSDQ